MGGTGGTTPLVPCRTEQGWMGQARYSWLPGPVAGDVPSEGAVPISMPRGSGPSMGLPHGTPCPPTSPPPFSAWHGISGCAAGAERG